RLAGSARLTAFQVLQAVTHEDAYANLVLPTRVRRNALYRQAAAFATELTYGTLRWTGTYAASWERCVDRLLVMLDILVLDVLRLVSQQVLRMLVPAHAALDTSVALVLHEIGTGPSGPLYAVLRKVR